MMGEIPMEDDRGKKRLADLKHRKKYECANCKNQTFILVPCSDFPFYEALCSKCGSLCIR